MYQRILLAYNATKGSRLALNEALRIVPVPSVEVHLAAVVEYPSAYAVGTDGVVSLAFVGTAAREDMERDLNEACAFLSSRKLNAIRHLLVGEPVYVLSKLVRELDIDLLILGHPRGQSFALRWWRGSVDHMLIERVRCSILIAAGSEPSKSS